MVIISYRLLIQIDIHFANDLDNILSNASQDSIFNNSQLIFPLIYSFPSIAIETGFQSISHFSFAVSHIFQEPNFLDSKTFKRAIVNTLLNSFYYILSDSITSIHLPIITFLLIYFSTHWPLIGTASIPDDSLQNLKKITSIILRIPIPLMISDSLNFMNIIISDSSHFFDIICSSKLFSQQTETVFQIGISVIKILTLLAQNNDNLKFRISNDIHSRSLILFVLWVLDHFTLTDFSYQQELHTPLSGLISQAIWTDSEKKDNFAFEFITQETFKEPFIDTIDDQTNESIYNSINDDNSEQSPPVVVTSEEKKFHLKFDYNSPFTMNRNDLLSNNFNLSKYFKPQHTFLITTIRLFLLEMSNDDKFLTDFVSSYFSLMDQIINKDESLYERFGIEKHSLLLSFHFFIILLFTQMESCDLKKIISNQTNGWPVIFHQLFFSPLINHWVDPTTDYYQFCFDIRRVITVFALQCFKISKQGNNEPMFKALHDLFSQSEPEIFDEGISIFSQLFKINPNQFVEVSTSTKIIEMFINQSIRLQSIHISFIEDKNCMVDFVKQTRIDLFNFIDLFLLESSSTCFFFKTPFFVRYLVSLLFEKNVEVFATNLIQKGMLLSDIHEIFKSVHFLLQQALNNMNDLNWIRMLNIFLIGIRNAFNLNRSKIMKTLKDQDILLELSQMSKTIIITNKEMFDEKHYDPQSEYVKFIKNVLSLVLILSHGSHSYASYIASNHIILENISKGLSMIDFQSDILNILLELIFEKQMDIDSLPNTAEIKNHYALPFVFNSTKHLEIHFVLIRFLTEVCTDSISNRLRVFQSQLPNLIIDQITQFLKQAEFSPNLEQSICESIKLFSVVSKYVFNVSTLYKCICAFKILRENQRMWWTGQLISLFIDYLKNASSTSSPASFFYLDGFQTYFDIPPFSVSSIAKGLSFVCRIELDSYRSNSSKKSPLLYIEFFSDFIFELYFMKMQLIIAWHKGKLKNIVTIDNITFDGNKWYDIVVTFSKSYIYTVYINGKAYYSSQLNQYPFKQKIKSITVANNSNKNSPLVANISCFYFLSCYLDQSIVSAFHSLPLDFVFGFSPSEKELNSSLPASLFNGFIESQLLLGTNARMTDQSECFNFATYNVIRNCKYNGYAFPFSVSFLDIVGYSGGVKLFLPLFEQVNLKVYGTSDAQESHINFLQDLIQLFVHFFASSPSLEDEFVEDGGFQSLSSLLTRINPLYINRTILNELGSLWDTLNKRHYRSMLSNIWLNFQLWDTLPIESKELLYSSIFVSIIKSNPHLVSSCLPIIDFLIVILRQKEKNIRRYMWDLLIMMAHISFTKTDQDNLFSTCFSNSKSRLISVQLEAFEVLYKFSCEKLYNCHYLFLRNGVYAPFLQLLRSPIEDIRICGLKFLFLIYSFNIVDRNLFIKSINQATTSMNSSNITKKTWNCLISMTFNTSDNYSLLETVEFTLPLLSSYSHFYSSEIIEQLIHHFLHSSNFFLITKCSMWSFWLFYLSNQLDLHFDIKHGLFELIENLCVHLAVNQQFKSYQTSMGFLLSLEIQSNLNLIYIISSILKKIMLYILSLAEDRNNLKYNQDLFNLIVHDTIFHLFFISRKEIYASNVQLYAEHGMLLSHTTKILIEGHQDLRNFIRIFSNSSIPPFSLSSRINEKGIWIDADLALIFIEFLCDYSVDHLPVYSPFPKIFTCDIFAYVLSFTIRYYRVINTYQISDLLQKISIFFSNKEITDSSKRIIVGFLNNIVSLSPQSNEVGSYPERLSPNNDKKTVNITFKIPGLQFTQELRQSDFLSKWLETFKSLESFYYDRTISQITKLWAEFKPMIHLLNQEKFDHFDYSIIFEKHLSSSIVKQKRSTLIMNKIASQLESKIKANGGPWSDHDIDIHWTYWRRMDTFMRHILMKPNLKFDNHIGASLKRDQSLNQEARLQYERWIEAQPENKKKRPTKKKTPVSFNFHSSASTDNLKSISTKMKHSKSMKEIKSTIDFYTDDEEREEEDEEEMQNEFDNNQIISNINADAQMITISSIFEGTFYISHSQICFTGEKISHDFGVMLDGQKTKAVQLDLDNLVWVLHRSYLHLDQGLEFFFNNGLSYFFYFISKNVREQVIRFLSSRKLEILQTTSSMKLISDQRVTEKWLTGQISTYEYLMLINFFAGRTFNDLSQYPVFPWILSDYDSPQLDLTNPATFRDLSKPVGALNETRLKRLQIEYSECPDDDSKCLYRSHYSTPYNVLHFMIRVEPFTTMHILMQEGKFDNPNRLFTSISRSYKSASTVLSDYRELLPEFFTFPDFLINQNGFNLGIEQGDDVILPKWALSPIDFIVKHREALECDYVGQHIGDWIDLIFGYKQNGRNAVEANNTFHAFCYEHSVTREVLNDPSQLLFIQQHAASFGITPRQIFLDKHPSRNPNANLICRAPLLSKSPVFSSIYEINLNLPLTKDDSDSRSNLSLQKLIQIDSSFETSESFLNSLNRIVCIQFNGTSLLVFTSDCYLSILNQRFELISKIKVPFYFESIGGFGPTNYRHQMKRNTICFFKKYNVLAALSPLEDSFHAYSITDHTSFNASSYSAYFEHLFSFRPKYSSLTSICAADDNTLILLSQDGSINVWKFVNSYNQSLISSSSRNDIMNTNQLDKKASTDGYFTDITSNYVSKEFCIVQKYRSNHHFITTLDAHGNGNLGFIASCDISKRLILTDLYSGSFMRSWRISDKSLTPQRVLVLDSGFIVVLCEILFHNDKRTVIQCYSVESDIIGAYDHYGGAIAWTPINYKDGNSFVAISYEDNTFVILSAPNLLVKMETRFSMNINEIELNKETNQIVISTIQGKILLTNL